MTNPNIRRYTSLPFLIDILYNHHLTFINPQNWDDKNDIYYLEQFKNLSRIKSVLVLCFTEASEMYHHWKIYSDQNNGICIEFDKDLLLNNFSDKNKFRMNYVSYKTIRGLQQKRPPLDQFPFIKRYAFKDEREYRIIYIDQNSTFDYINFNIDINCISRILFNPWLPRSIYESIKCVLNYLPDCESIKIEQSALTNNWIWKSLID